LHVLNIQNKVLNIKYLCKKNSAVEHCSTALFESLCLVAQRPRFSGGAFLCL